MTVDETKSHFTAWALMKSPLLIGTNVCILFSYLVQRFLTRSLFTKQLSAISDTDLEILKNEEIIAINQDPVFGTSISHFRWGVNPDWTSDPYNPANYWSGPTQNGTVIMLVRIPSYLHKKAS